MNTIHTHIHVEHLRGHYMFIGSRRDIMENEVYKYDKLYVFETFISEGWSIWSKFFWSKMILSDFESFGANSSLKVVLFKQPIRKKRHKK